MRNALLAASLVASAAVFAQAPAAPAASETQSAEEMRREFDAKLEAARKELRDEMRAQLATQSAEEAWEEDWTQERRKLELLVLDGYFRVRPELFNRFDLGRAADPSGYTLFPRSPVSLRDRTQAGVNMRLRMEPTLNVSEEVRVRMQVDVLDNVLFGSSPDYAFSRGILSGYAYERDLFPLFSQSQTAPRSAVNALYDSIMVRRAYGEVGTPVGILRFGRMGSHWGLGMLHNDGNGIDNDWGDTVDRIMFVTEPVSGLFVAPMLDFNVEGPSSIRTLGGGQPFDLSNSDDTHSFLLAIARRDTDMQARAKLDSGASVFNYGLHFAYRVQRNEAVDFLGRPWVQDDAYLPPGAVPPSGGYVTRNGSLYIPDVWLKFERKEFRVELELAAVFGGLGNRAESGALANAVGANQALSVRQFGGVAQGEYRFLDGALRVGLELGFASGDRAPGFGNYPRRRVVGADNNTQPGDIDGPQFACQSTGGCTDSSIRNFRFNRDYRVDLILWREILGGVTDAFYGKPSITYRLAEGFDLFGAIIYSRAIYEESTPSYDGTTGSADLGIELNAGARYETEDGFYATVMYGTLFPLAGLSDPRAPAGTALENAHVFRGILGVKF